MVHGSRQQAEALRAEAATALARLGLRLAEEKTREPTRGPDSRLGCHWLARQRGPGTAAKAEDLQGGAGAGLEEGPQLQKLMLRSLSNMLVSVRQITQGNAGRKTAGIDGQVALTSRDRPELAERLHRHAQLSPITAGYVVTVMDDVAQPSVRSIVASSSGVSSGPPTAPRL